MEEKMRGKHIDIPIGLLETNDGQITGIPDNPREIDEKEFKALKKNLKEVPRMLDARGLIVYPIDGGHYIVLGGNQRLRALREDKKVESVPCFVLPEDTTEEEMRAMIILDNSQRGSWDWDKLANQWDAGKLQDWGVPAWNNEATDVEGLFEDAQGGSSNEASKIVVEVPQELEDKLNDIRAAIKVTLEDWKGCKVQ